MFMAGAPSHVDTFDYKPQLQADDGKTGRRQGQGPEAAEVSLQVQPARQERPVVAGDLPEPGRSTPTNCACSTACTPTSPCIRNATIEMHTGNFRFSRPSMGAWTLYGLGTENSELPGFITLNPQGGGAQNYGSAFLPASYQGTRIERRRAEQGRPIANIENPKLSAELQRKQLDLLATLNRERLEKDKVNPELEGVIESYELAFRMEGAVPQVMDISDETEATQEAYGIGDKGTDNFGRQCLLARRFAEAGVRFIEIGMGGWDQHNNLKAKLTTNCHVDRQADRRPAGRPEAARHAQGHAGRLGRRIRPHARRAEQRRPRPQRHRLFDVDGRRRRQRGLSPRRDRRARRRGRRQEDAHQRPARHDAVPAGPRPREADLPVQRPAIRLTDLAGVVAKDVVA